MEKELRNNKLYNKLFKIINKCNFIIERYKDSGSSLKEDGTLVTKADLEADKYIHDNLRDCFPNIPIISEERKNSYNYFSSDEYWLIDPLDGTSSFVKGLSDYTTNIALIKKGIPIIGAIGHPPSGKIWLGGLDGANLILQNGENHNLLENNISWEKPLIITSRNINIETKLFVESIKNAKVIKESSSIKFCRIANSEINLYPRFASISKWDIAAGHAIINAVGGKLEDLNGKEFNYSGKSVKTNKFIASRSKDWRRILRYRN